MVESADGGVVGAQELREAYDFPVIDHGVRGESKEALRVLDEGAARSGGE